MVNCEFSINIPLSAVQTTLRKRGEDLKQRTGKINRRVIAVHALVHDLASLGDPIVFDRDSPAAVTVSHDAEGQDEDKFGFAIIGRAARARIRRRSGSVVVCHLAGAG